MESQKQNENVAWALFIGSHKGFLNLVRSKGQLIFLFLVLFSVTESFAQTTTIASGNWSNPVNWSNGVPGNGTTITVNNSMTLDVNLSPSATYTINAPVIDPSGGSAYSLSVSGTLDIHANMQAEGTLSIGAFASTTVRSGDTLIIGYPGSTATSTISPFGTLTIESNAVLIIYGDLYIASEATIQCDGQILIDGNFTGDSFLTIFASSISGSGTISTTGSMTTTGWSTVFGSGNDCNSGPCSGGNLCGISNAISGAQSVCGSGSIPSTITGSNISSITYQWQQSTISAIQGFTNISGATSQNLSFSSNVSVNTWYRRVATTTGGCSNPSPSVAITVAPYVTASVSISSSVTTICSSTSVTFTATPTNGGSSPSYQWKKNGSNVGTNSETYSNSGLSDGDVISCVMSSNASCITGSPATSNSITVTVVSGAGSWVGVTSNNWKTGSNWCSNSKPTSTTNVVITGGVTNDPLVSSASGAAVCKNMTINNGGLLTVAGSTLTINGNLNITSGGSLIITGGTVTVTGNLTVNSGSSVTITSPGALNVQGNITNSDSIIGTGMLTLNGTSSQVISGSSGVFANVTLNNSSGCLFASPQTITGILTLTSGTLTSTGNLTLDLNTGAVSGTGSGSLSGNLNVKKSISSTGYHYLSAPMAGITPSQFADDVYLNVMYAYNESLVTSDSMQGWTGVTNFGSSMIQMIGYAFDLESTGNITLTGTYNHNGSYSSTLTHTNTNAGNLNTGGWNLVGNPYPCTIDWDAASGWTKSNIDNSICYWDPVTETYASYVSGASINGGTQYIPSLQGFYVHVSSVGTGTFGMNKNVRTTSVNPSLWKMSAVSNVLRLKANHIGYQDETVIRLSEEATDSFDGELDAYKMYNESAAPELYSTLGGVDYSINSLSDSADATLVPLNLRGSGGDYTIYATGIESFDGSYEIYLIDSVANVVQDLKFNSAYIVSINEGEKRKLYVNFKKSAVSGIQIGSSVVSETLIGSDGSNLIVKFENTTADVATISIFDLLGNKVFEVKKVNTDQTFNSSIPVSKSGLYLVKINSNDKLYSGKVILYK